MGPLEIRVDQIPSLINSDTFDPIDLDTDRVVWISLIVAPLVGGGVNPPPDDQMYTSVNTPCPIEMDLSVQTLRSPREYPIVQSPKSICVNESFSTCLIL